MSEIIEMDHIYQYNDRVNMETLHPLISVIDFSLVDSQIQRARMRYGFYSVFLKEVKCGDLHYGKNYYDYQEGTMVFTGPGQVVGVESNGEYVQPKG